MKEELDSLKENDTFELTSLLKGRNTVGGNLVYTIKKVLKRGTICKARYIAKGYNQKKGIDYHETFATTANLSSIRALMQVAVHDRQTT